MVAPLIAAAARALASTAARATAKKAATQAAARTASKGAATGAARAGASRTATTAGAQAERRSLYRSLQNVKSKVRDYAKAYRQEARNLTRSWREQHGKEKLPDEIRQMQKTYRREADRLEKLAKRSNIRGKSNEWVENRIDKLATKAGSGEGFYARNNALVEQEMRMAIDEYSTNLFGSGKAARANIQSFWMYYKRDWQGRTGNRYELIRAAHGNRSLQQLYADFVEAVSDGQTWYEFVADNLKIDYANVDTDSSAFRSQVMEEFESLDSPTKDEIAQMWAGVAQH